MTALAEMCLGKTDAARELLTRSLDVDPKQPPIREALAKLSQGGTAR
jgi:Tfp pilus assembly protein PilF